MHLSRDVLRGKIEEGLISGYSDIDAQVTANGFDVRIAALVEIESAGRLAIEKSDNLPPRLGKAVVLRGFEHRLKGYDLKDVKVVDSGVVRFERLKPYFAITCEEVDTPPSMMFHIAARSSLFRLTQSSLLCSFGEAGYKGFLTFMLLPFLDGEIELGARFAQLSFSELKGEARYEDQKETNHQGGVLFSSRLPEN